MFTILGGDGKEYGPVTVAQIRTWMHGGRANVDTQARAVGSAEWRRLGDFEEFSPTPGAFARPSATLPPPPPPAFGAAPMAPVAPVTSFASFAPAESLDLAGQGARIGAAFINLAFYCAGVVPGLAIAVRIVLREFPEAKQGKFISPDRVAQLDPAVLLEVAAWVYGGLLLAILFQTVLLAFRGQNLGKLMVGIRVVRVDGSAAGFLRGTFLRYLIPVGMCLVFLQVPYLGPLLMMGFIITDLCFMFREDRRCLHDLVAGTTVVKK